MNNHTPRNPGELRRQAEAQAATMEPASLSAQAPEAIERLIHELRVHQIELEMQNEELRRAQAEIEAGRARYFDLYDLAPAGYCTLSDKGLILETNLTAATLLGTARGALVKQPFSRFIVKEDQDTYYLHRKKLCESGKPQECDLRLVKPDGTLFWARLTATAAQAEDGAPLCRMVLSDISAHKQAEEVLKRKEHDLCESQRIAHVGSWRLDVATNQVVWTKELYNMYGFDPSCPPPPYTEHMKLFTPESWMRVSTALALARDTGVPYTLELETVRKDGRRGWMWVRGEADVDSSGKTVGLWGAAQDITERKQSEETLRRSEAHFRNAFTHSAIGMALVSPDGKWLRVNKRVSDILGYTADELMGKTFQEITHPEDLATDLDFVRQMLDGEIETYQMEKRYLHKDGHLIWGLLAVTLVRNGCGTPLHFISQIQDITERKREQDAVRESELKFRTLVEASSSGIWRTTNASGRNTYVSPRWCKITGMSEADAAGRGWASGLHPEDRIPVQTGWEAAATAAKNYTAEFRFVHPSGRLVWVLCQASPVKVGEHVAEWIGTITDITARKDAEEKLRESETRFRGLFENHAAVKLIIDPVTGAILDANPAAAEYYGWSRETMRLMRIQDINTLTEQEIKQEMLAAVEQCRNYFEFRHRRADGSLRDVAVLSCRVAEADRAVLYSVIYDVTNHKRLLAVQSYLAHSSGGPADEPFFRSLAKFLASSLDASFVCIDLLDGDGLTARTVAVWHAGHFEDNVTYALKDTPCGAVVGKEVCSFPSGVCQFFPHDPVLRELGAEGYVGVTLFDHVGRPIGLIAVITQCPITDPLLAEATMKLVALRASSEMERQGAEAQLREKVLDLAKANRELKLTESGLVMQEKLVSVGRLAAGISHEINNPIGFLMNNFEALRDDVAMFRGLLDGYRALCIKARNLPELAEDVARMEAMEVDGNLDFVLRDLDALFRESDDGFQRTLKILGCMRNFARSGTDEEKSLYSLDDAVRSTLVIARNEYKYHCHVSVEHGDDLPLAHCVPGKINQVILNLVVNAAQAIAGQDRDVNGEIVIRTFAEGPSVCIEIADNGPGIPAAVLDKVFEPFFTTKPPGSGTGLGLSISYDIVVNQHGGSLTVDSREGHGATFRVYLPVGGAPAAENRRSP